MDWLCSAMCAGFGLGVMFAGGFGVLVMSIPPAGLLRW